MLSDEKIVTTDHTVRLKTLRVTVGLFIFYLLELLLHSSFSTFALTITLIVIDIVMQKYYHQTHKYCEVMQKQLGKKQTHHDPQGAPSVSSQNVRKIYPSPTSFSLDMFNQENFISALRWILFYSVWLMFMIWKTSSVT